MRKLDLFILIGLAAITIAIIILAVVMKTNGASCVVDPLSYYKSISGSSCTCWGNGTLVFP